MRLLLVFDPDRDVFGNGLPDEAECERRLENLRWPEGFRCPRCGHDRGERNRTRAVKCVKCGAQVRLLTAGTLLQGTRLPLARWFGAMAWLAEHPDGPAGELAAGEIAKAVGVSPRTAGRWLKALGAAKRTSPHRLLGNVSVTCWRFVILPSRVEYLMSAVERGGGGQIRMKMCPDVRDFVKGAVEPGSALDVDHVEWQEALRAAGYHVRVSPGSGWDVMRTLAEWREALRAAGYDEGDLDTMIPQAQDELQDFLVRWGRRELDRSTEENLDDFVSEWNSQRRGRVGFELAAGTGRLIPAWPGKRPLSPGRRAPRVRLRAGEWNALERQRQQGGRRALRARIILKAADGATNRAIAKELKCSIGTVGRWRRRWVEGRGLRRRAREPRWRKLPGAGLITLPEGAWQWPLHRIAARLGVSPATAWRWQQAGRIRCQGGGPGRGRRHGVRGHSCERCGGEAMRAGSYGTVGRRWFRWRCRRCGRSIPRAQCYRIRMPESWVYVLACLIAEARRRKLSRQRVSYEVRTVWQGPLNSVYCNLAARWRSRMAHWSGRGPFGRVWRFAALAPPAPVHLDLAARRRFMREVKELRQRVLGEPGLKALAENLPTTWEEVFRRAERARRRRLRRRLRDARQRAGADSRPSAGYPGQHVSAVAL